jgi:argininosuccinate lyase
MTTFMLQQVSVKKDILEDKKFDHLFSVEAVNRLVQTGIPFRDAYKQVGRAIEAGEFTPERALKHTHEGSMGRLCNPEIAAQYQSTRDRFPFQQIGEQIVRLLTGE